MFLFDFDRDKEEFRFALDCLEFSASSCQIFSVPRGLSFTDQFRIRALLKEPGRRAISICPKSAYGTL